MYLSLEELKQLEEKIVEVENKIRKEYKKKMEITNEKEKLGAKLEGSSLSENKKKEILNEIEKLYNMETEQIRTEEVLINQLKSLIIKIKNHDQAVRDRVNSQWIATLRTQIPEQPQVAEQIATLRTQLGITKTKGGKSKKHKKTIHKKTNHKKTIHKKHKKTIHKKHKKTKKV